MIWSLPRQTVGLFQIMPSPPMGHAYTRGVLPVLASAVLVLMAWCSFVLSHGRTAERKSPVSQSLAFVPSQASLASSASAPCSSGEYSLHQQNGLLLQLKPVSQHSVCAQDLRRIEQGVRERCQDPFPYEEAEDTCSALQIGCWVASPV